MLMDKSGLRRKSKKVKSKGISKYTDKDLTEMNRRAGIDFLEKEEALGNLNEEERAELLRLKLKNG